MTTLLIVGTGLIGGSIALAARRRQLVDRVIGVDDSVQAREAAGGLGIIDEACASLPEAAARADLVVVCTPVDTIAERVLIAARAARPGTLLTDAGSTKAAIVRAVEADLPEGVAFVGGHPLAGSEKHGPGHADPDLFRGKLVLLTPTPRTSQEALGRVGSFWQGLGAEVMTIEPDHHDRALALTSHLPHVVASALAGVLPPAWHGLTGPGFRDTTRLACGHPRVWLPILRENRGPLLEALSVMRAQLDRFAAALEADDTAALEALLEQGRQARLP